ncbi:hypothetical protein [Paracoccus aminovorans]|uniref:hypothetical protein n=1 Tax=Paracoccus aminovorans TaxID=34004 RepID=UPI000784FE28|nr:hypothetical protein [Paracoccus aminovorans]MDQ7777215.1 hypothetical protein [Paracoccus aminovorans]
MDGDFPRILDGKLPGTALHAPQVRIVTDKGEPLTVDGNPISPDIVSSVVTLPASGTAVADIVLNNQRNDKANPNRPAAPSWRYNALKEVSFGKVFRVDYRYGQEPWTPMILARITGVDFNFPSAAGAQVTLKGEDFSSLLKVKPQEPMIYMEDHETFIVQSEVGDGAPDLKMAPLPESPFSETISLTRPTDKTRLQFIAELAERMDFEAFVAFNDDTPIKQTGAVERPVAFHFAPARSATLGTVVTLLWGRDLIDFKPAFSVWDIPTQATASGNVPRDRGAIDETVSYDADRALVVNDLHGAPDGGAPMDAVKARNDFFNARPAVNPISVKVENLDTERARLAAAAAMRKGIRGFLTAELSTLGLTTIRPGIHVDLKGLYAPFDGIWYVTQTVHTLNAAGYITKTSLRRPGMLDPAGYPGASQ